MAAIGDVWQDVWDEVWGEVWENTVAIGEQPLRARQFDGVDGYVDVGSVQTLSGEFSVSVWVNASAYAKILLGRPISSADYIYLQSANSLTVRANGVDTAIAHNLALPTDEWFHLAITRNSSDTITIYKDAAASGTTGSNSNDWDWETIGRNNSGLYFTGHLHDLRIYDRELTADEITALADSATAYNTATDPVAWYPLEEVHDAYCWDASGNGNHGTISGGATTDDSAAAEYSLWNLRGGTRYVGGFTDSAYLSRADQIAYDATSSVARVQFATEADATPANSQFLFTQGAIQPISLRIATNGELQLRYATSQTQVLFSVAAFTYYDISINVQPSADTVTLTDNIDGSLDNEWTGLTIDDSPTPAGSFYVGRYSTGGGPANETLQRLVDYTLDGTLTHSLDLLTLSGGTVEDSVGSFDLTETGSLFIDFVPKSALASADVLGAPLEYNPATNARRFMQQLLVPAAT